MTIEEYKKEVEQVRPQMLRLARSYLKDDEEAEDAVQDVLLRLWQMLESLHLPMAPMASVLVKNRCVDIIRRRRTTTSIPENLVDYEPTNDERYAKVMQIADRLPTFQQTILRLRRETAQTTS